MPPRKKKQPVIDPVIEPTIEPVVKQVIPGPTVPERQKPVSAELVIFGTVTNGKQDFSVVVDGVAIKGITVDILGIGTNKTEAKITVFNPQMDIKTIST